MTGRREGGINQGAVFQGGIGGAVVAFGQLEKGSVSGGEAIDVVHAIVVGGKGERAVGGSQMIDFYRDGRKEGFDLSARRRQAVQAASFLRQGRERQRIAQPGRFGHL